MSGINGFDGAIMAWVQTHCHNAFTDGLFPVLTYLGEAGAVWIVLALIFLCQKRTRYAGILTLCAMAAGFLLGEVLLKNAVCRERPFALFPDYTVLLISPPSGFSFPSGHTCASFAAATVLSCQFKKRGIPALLLAGLIGFSRIFLFVHYPTDVLAGAILGAACGLLTCWAAEKIKQRNELTKSSKE